MHHRCRNAKVHGPAARPTRYQRKQQIPHIHPVTAQKIAVFGILQCSFFCFIPFKCGKSQRQPRQMRLPWQCSVNKCGMRQTTCREFPAQREVLIFGQHHPQAMQALIRLQHHTIDHACFVRTTANHRKAVILLRPTKLPHFPPAEIQATCSHLSHPVSVMNILCGRIKKQYTRNLVYCKTSLGYWTVYPPEISTVQPCAETNPSPTASVAYK